MNALRVSMTLAVAFVAVPGFALGQAKQYVGEIFIVGNTQTPDRIIRAQLGFYPGQKLVYPELRVAEHRLTNLNWFLVDTKKGIRPTVTTLDNPGPFKDILIKVHERPGNWARLAAWDIVLARSTMDYSRLFDAADAIRFGIRNWSDSEMKAPEALPAQSIGPR